MKKKEILRRRVPGIALSAVLVFSFTGCAGSAMRGSVNLMEEGYDASARGSVNLTEEGQGASAGKNRPALIVSEPFSPEAEGGTAELADADELFHVLEQLAYSSETCDGLPEYSITFPESGLSGESTQYDVNLTEGWVWKNRDMEAELTGSSAEELLRLICGAAPAEDNGVEGAALITDFGLRLLRVSPEPAEGGNILLSPLSVLSALAMTANGAGGDTLEQMEAVFGMSVPELNQYLSAYREALPEGEKYKLHIANAIWFKDTGSFSVEQEFLKRNEEFYQAGLYKASFDDSTLEDINGWVKDNTDGMIDRILDRISQDAVMYLVNALAFEAEWEKVYQTDQVREGIFTKEDGTCQDVTLMYSSEHQYLASERAEGFLKYYADGKYAFAALLPGEGIPVEDYLESLTGKELHKMLDNPVEVKVNAAIPKYKSEYGAEISQVLAAMGMPDAFDADRADFSGIGFSLEGNLYISRVLHKTFIEIDSKGTKAGAATVAAMASGAAMTPQEEVRTVYLDRPFVYLIIDCEEKLPVFIGVVTSVR